MNRQVITVDSSVDKKLKEAIALMGNVEEPITQEVIQAAREMLKDFNEKGLVLKDFLKIQPEVIDKFYEHGYNLFQAGRYKEALRAFEVLHHLDISNASYIFSKAACYHYLKEYRLAAGNYLQCISLDAKNPLPYFYLSDCFRNNTEYPAALCAISSVIYLTKNQPEYALLKEKAELEEKSLEEMIKKTQL